MNGCAHGLLYSQDCGACGRQGLLVRSLPLIDNTTYVSLLDEAVARNVNLERAVQTAEGQLDQVQALVDLLRNTLRGARQ